MPGPIRRKITMLNHIPRAPRKISVSDLVAQLARDGYATTARTVQRDLNELAQDFPLESDDARPQGWSWRKGASIDTFGMDSHAAFTFGLVEQYLAPLLPRTTLSHVTPWFDAATHIRETMDPKLQLWHKRIRVLTSSRNSTPPTANIDVQDMVYDALLNGRQLLVTYKAITGAGEAKTYPLHPWGLLVREATTYLIGSAKNYNSPRLFKLHRIEQATLLKEEAQVPDSFDIDKFVEQEWGISIGSKPLTVRLAVSPLIAKYLQESPMDDQTVIQPSGPAIFEFSSPDNEKLRTWLLSLGADAEVLHPKQLRAEIQATIESMHERYTSTPITK